MKFYYRWFLGLSVFATFSYFCIWFVLGMGIYFAEGIFKIFMQDWPQPLRALAGISFGIAFLGSVFGGYDYASTRAREDRYNAKFNAKRKASNSQRNIS